MSPFSLSSVKAFVDSFKVVMKYFFVLTRKLINILCRIRAD